MILSSLNTSCEYLPDTTVSPTRNNAVFLEKDLQARKYRLCFLVNKNGVWFSLNDFILSGSPKSQDIDDEDFTAPLYDYDNPVLFFKDESMLVVGSLFSGDTESGLVYIFKLTPKGWVLFQTLEPIKKDTESFGYCIELEEAETTLKVWLNKWSDNEICVDVFTWKNDKFIRDHRDEPEMVPYVKAYPDKLEQLMTNLKHKLSNPKE